ncbi:SusF/SusE family outer membrane protein [Flavobacterium sp. 3HN19-14]|uniref:SusF/SusE family outer membrane protein n=1 Tax=Flavobacterium sp. 3HN19-14 TaxID=3448133 RepID=UPI003EE2F86E
MSNFYTLHITPYPAWPNWGIIGSATATGWDSDTNLDYDLTTHLYSITMPLTAGGAFKFRLDDGWGVNFGDNGNDHSLDSGGADIPVTVSGTYKIVVNFGGALTSPVAFPEKSYTITLQ